MYETRAGKYGRNLATWVNHTIAGIPKSQREDYRAKFLQELKIYSFSPRKKGRPRNSGCVHELKDVDKCDVRNPEDLAKLVKESIHLMYQKQTAARVMKSLLDYL